MGWAPSVEVDPSLPVFDSVLCALYPLLQFSILRRPLQFVVVVIAIGMTQPDAIQYNCPHSAHSLSPSHPIARSLAHTDIPIPFIHPSSLPRSIQPPLPMPDSD